MKIFFLLTSNFPHSGAEKKRDEKDFKFFWHGNSTGMAYSTLITLLWFE